MTEEKQIILNKIDRLLAKRTAELKNEFPDVHEVNDGIIARFFGEWDNCDDNRAIKFKRITNHDDPNESVVFFFIPKGEKFELEQRFYIGCLTCLNGVMEITSKGKMLLLENYSKVCLHSDDVEGYALENTYLIAVSNKSKWSDAVQEHVQIYVD